MIDESLLSSHYTINEQQAIERFLQDIDVVLPVSRGLYTKIVNVYSVVENLPFEVLYPPIDLKNMGLICPEPILYQKLRHKLLIVTVARLVPGKQVLECVRAHYALKSKGMSFSWCVIGVGSEESIIRENIVTLDMQEDFFLLTGSTEDVYFWMRQCDIFVLFSNSEGCPTVILEAQYYGAPVIMSAVNGADELIEHNETGLIIPNHIDALKESIHHLITNKILREKFKKNALKKYTQTHFNEKENLLSQFIEKNYSSPILQSVSIIIPTYNQKAYIDRAIGSALMQNFLHLEVIVLDDASTDGTEMEIKKWVNHPAFHCVRNRENMGRVKNYHQGLVSHAKGEWVLLLDGDDFLINPGFIKYAVKMATAHANISPVFIQAGHRSHYIKNSKRDRDILPAIKNRFAILHPGHYLCFVFETGFFTHLGALYNRQKAIDCQFYTHNISSTDMVSFFELSLCGPVIVLNQIAGYWVHHGKNISGNVPVKNILDNIVFFRLSAQKAISLGYIKQSDIAFALEKYELHTLYFLLCSALKKNIWGIFYISKILIYLKKYYKRKFLIQYFYQIFKNNLFCKLHKIKSYMYFCIRFIFQGRDV